MTKRKKKGSDAGEQSAEEQAAENNGALGESTRLRSAVFGGQHKLHQLDLACKQLKRIQNPGPEHVHKFIERVFGIADVELS